MKREIMELSEGRAFFVILNLLVGLGVMMAVASVGVLIVAALTF